MKPTLELIIKPIESESWWAKLNDQDRKDMKEIDTTLSEALAGYRRSRMEIGEALIRAQDKLTPHGCFLQYMERNFPFSQRTGFRMMEEWRARKKNLPERVITEAVRLGVDLVGTSKKPFGEYTAAVAELPPPEKPSARQASEWLREIVQKRNVLKARREPKTPRTDHQEEMRIAFAVMRRRQRRVYEEERVHWTEHLCGLMLSSIGITKMRRIEPQPIPPEWIVTLGRPKAA